MAERTAELFTKAFGRAPRWTVAAPGRVNLLGGHTDYNEGFVLPMAIERHIVISANRTADREVTLHSLTTGDTATFSLRPSVQKGDPPWSNYVRGVVAQFQKNGDRVAGFEAVIDSDLPYGGGLASSAALEVAVATLVETIRGENLDLMEKALLCQRAEHEFAGVPCGIMDQVTSVFGEADCASLLDCRSREITRVPMNDRSVTVLIINTQTRHRVAETEYAKRRSQCQAAAAALGVSSLRDVDAEELRREKTRLDPVVFRRARHVISENERTLLAAEAIQQANWAEMGRLMYASHCSLRNDYEVSSPELDYVVEIAQSLGAAQGMIGCRMTGAGFGGCAVSLVQTDAVQHLTRRIQEAYEIKTNGQPIIFHSRPAGGARLLQ